MNICPVGAGFFREDRLTGKYNEAKSRFSQFYERAHKRMKVNGIGHILRRNCLPKHLIEEKREETGRRGRRLKQLLDYLQ